MKKILLALLLPLGFVGQAQAVPMWGIEWDAYYNDDFDFDLDAVGAGLVEFDDVANTITIRGFEPDDPDFGSYFTSVITSDAIDLTAFDALDLSWTYTNDDPFAPESDPFLFTSDWDSLISVILTPDAAVTSPIGPNDLNGASAGVDFDLGDSVLVGDYFPTPPLSLASLWGFEMFSDGFLGAGTVTISSGAFPRPAVVPLPPTFLLFGVGMVGLAWARRKEAGSGLNRTD